MHVNDYFPISYLVLLSTRIQTRAEPYDIIVTLLAVMFFIWAIASGKENHRLHFN